MDVTLATSPFVSISRFDKTQTGPMVLNLSGRKVICFPFFWYRAFVVARAYFCAKTDPECPTYVELPREDPDSGAMVGRRLRHMCGTRAAADGWHRHESGNGGRDDRAQLARRL